MKRNKENEIIIDINEVYKVGERIVLKLIAVNENKQWGEILFIRLLI